MANESARQVAALPWRKRRGRLEVLLVTSRTTQRWVIPKGGVMPHLVDMNAARQEAFEEAGISGRMKRKPLGTYTYAKRTASAMMMQHAVKVFAFEVQRELSNWPERRQRKRQWFRLEDALKKIGEPSLREIIRAFAAAKG